MASLLRRDGALFALLAAALPASAPAIPGAAPFLEKLDLFAEGQNGFVSYRILGIVVAAKGTVLAYCEARKFTSADRGEIEIHLPRLPLLEVENEIFRELLTYKLLTCRDRIFKSACSGDQPYSTILRFCYNLRCEWGSAKK